ncbi:hypothetical protein [Mucilaginibacter jinjuensis]|uniref:Uncharacterized protein n=1 Tax=Mucilaginibacter jinjuensis TaxID=1176721 RepID=A0ABY7T6Z5_9SPHI|nr:hypothetical protein [Mucilaginibacter jinjuensis]WCT12048.1 hypothetical protein PQO05_25270 [Mucilaginibacter jinjuensis]
MNKQLIVLVYVFVALTGLSVFIHRHLPDAAVNSHLTFKKNLHVTAHESRQILSARL